MKPRCDELPVSKGSAQVEQRHVQNVSVTVLSAFLLYSEAVADHRKLNDRVCRDCQACRKT